MTMQLWTAISPKKKIKKNIKKKTKTKKKKKTALCEEVKIAVVALKKAKSVRVDSIPAELVQAGGVTIIAVLTEICNKVWRTGEWPSPYTQWLIITLPKKGNLQLCQKYRTINFTSHSSKAMLKVILIGLNSEPKI